MRQHFTSPLPLEVFLSAACRNGLAMAEPYLKKVLEHTDFQVSFKKGNHQIGWDCCTNRVAKGFDTTELESNFIAPKDFILYHFCELFNFVSDAASVTVPNLNELAVTFFYPAARNLRSTFKKKNSFCMAVSISEIDMQLVFIGFLMCLKQSWTLKQVVNVSHSEQVHFLVVYRLYPPLSFTLRCQNGEAKYPPCWFLQAVFNVKIISRPKQVTCVQNMQKRKCEITPIADINSNLKRPRNAKSSLMGVSSPTNRRPAWGFATLHKTHMNPTRKSVPFYDIRHLLRDQKISFQGIHLRNVQDSHGFWWPGVNSDLEALSCVTGQVGMSFIPLAPMPAPGPPQWTKVPLKYQILYIFLLKVAAITQLQLAYLQKKALPKNLWWKRQSDAFCQVSGRQ